MAGQLQFQVLTPTGTIYDEPVYEVVAPTTEGELGILPHHIPIVAVTQLGVVAVRRQQQDPNTELDHLVIGQGLLEVTEGHVRMVVDEAEHVDTIDELVIKQELAAAQQRLKAAQDRLELATAGATVERSLTWLKGAELSRGGSRNAATRR